MDHADTVAWLADKVARARAVRWDYASSPEEEVMPSFLRREASDPNTLADIGVIIDALDEAGWFPGALPKNRQPFEEWRVYGDPGRGLPPYDHFFDHRTVRNPKQEAINLYRLLIGWCGSEEAWDFGPHLTRRLVYTGDWEDFEVPDVRSTFPGKM